MFRLFLSHPQVNAEFRCIKCAPNEIPLRLQNISLSEITGWER